MKTATVALAALAYVGGVTAQWWDSTGCGTTAYPNNCYRYCDKDYATDNGGNPETEGHAWCWTNNDITCYTSNDCALATACTSRCSPY